MGDYDLTRRDFMTMTVAAGLIGANTGGPERQQGGGTNVAVSEYTKFDGVGLAELVRKKRVKPEELLDEAIRQAEALNPQLNCIVFKDYERARNAAKGHVPLGVFAGVPFLLKDSLGYAQGMPTREASRFYPATPWDHDSVIVSRFKAAGLISFGKTNVPELVLMFTTESDLYGPARNPWNLEHSTGGSSGGSAAAVAAGIVPLAHGADGGGSIRVPASCCGLVGLKPTRGRTSYAPDHGDVWDGFEVQGVLSRSVRDTAAALDVIAGGAAGDPYATPLGPDSYLKAIARPPKRLRIAFTTQRADGSKAHPDCAAAVNAAVALCSQLGHDVEEDTPALGPYDAFYRSFVTIVEANIAASVDAVAAVTNAKPSSDLFQPNTWRLYELGKGLSAATYLRAKGAIHALARKVAQFHQRYDAFLMPTLGMPPIKLGTWRNGESDWTKLDPSFAAYVNTQLQNATGQPAISLPLHWNGSNLPIGVHFAGRFGDEETLLRLAAQLEHAAPWSHRYTKTGL